MVPRRCRELGIKHVVQGEDDKWPVLDRLLKRLKLDAAECACIGDDVLDVPIWKRPASPSLWLTPTPLHATPRTA